MTRRMRRVFLPLLGLLLTWTATVFAQEAGSRAEEEARDILAEATWAILGELNEENVGRLDAFLPLAEQAKRALQQKQTPDHKPEQLAALCQ